MALIANAEVIGTSSAIDTTGATLLVAVVAGQSPSISDNKSNSWTKLTAKVGPFSSEVAIWYVANPTVGTGHTFTISGSFPSACVEAHSGVVTTSPFDQQNGTDTTTSNSGSITPTEDNELIIAGAGGSNAGLSIDSGYTQTGNIDLVGSVNFGSSIAYLYQGTAAATNPTWSMTSGDIGAVIASFKTTGGGGGTANPWYYRLNEHAVVG